MGGGVMNKDNIPDGATHIDHMGRFWDFPNGLVWQNNTWMKDGTGFACIWQPLPEPPEK